MTKEDILIKIKPIISELLGLDPDLVTPEKSFIDDLGADSIAIVEMLMTFEDTFNMEIAEEKTSSLKTVGDIIQLVEQTV